MFEFDMIQCGLIVLLLMVIGEVVSRYMRAAIPAILVSAMIYLGCIWTGLLPRSLVQDSGLTHLTSLSMMFIIVGMGASTNPKELMENWKVVAIAACSYFMQVVTMLVVIGYLFDPNLAIGSLPGGASVALIVQERARTLGYDKVVLLSVLVVSVKGLISCPLASFALRREVKRRKREGIQTDGGERFFVGAEERRRENQDTAFMSIFRFFVAAWMASRLEILTGISRYVFCLLLGVLLTKIGFLYKDTMDRAKMHGILMLMLMSMILNGFSTSTPEMFMEMMLPLACVIAVEVISIFVNSLLLGRVFGFSRSMSFALCLNVMVGFPLNMMIAQDVIGLLVKNPYEKETLNRQISTKMVIAGFTSVTFLSTITMGMIIGFMR